MSMEQKTQQQTLIAIKEEITDTNNCSAKENGSLRITKMSVKASLKEPNEPTDVVTKVERSGSPIAVNNFRGALSPKGNVPAAQSSLLNITPSTDLLKNILANSSSSTSDKLSPSLTVPPSHSITNNGNNNNNSSASEPEQSPATSKTLLKVKRLLSTLLQFANSLNADVGESVKNLIFNLACNAVSIEEFHNNLQEVTNFPLRPFVLPFLKNYIPVLQKEISLQAKSTKQSVQHYIRQNENSVLDPYCSTSELNEVFNQMEAVSPSNQSELFSNNTLLGKHRYSECHENNTCHKADSPTDGPLHLVPPPTKKHALNMMCSSHTAGNHQPSFYSVDYFQIPPPPCLSTGNWIASTPPAASTKECGNSHLDDRKSVGGSSTTAGNSEWNNIYVMLNCILSMVEKTKRALAILQERSAHENNCVNIGDGFNINGVDHNSLLKRTTAEEMKRTANELMAHTIRLTEEKVAFVRKKAEEAVNEVKKQAILELQKAILSADYKSMECNSNGNLAKISAENKKSFLSVNEQEFSTHNGCSSNEKLDSAVLFSPSIQTNNCWNCGRKAQETCSGCNLAKYCGSFCQHKDWESHHQICSGYVNSNLINLEKVIPTSRGNTSTFADPFITRTNLFNDLINKSNSTISDLSSLIKSQNSSASEICRLLPFPINVASMPSEKSTVGRNATNSRPVTPVATSNTSAMNASSSKVKK